MYDFVKHMQMPDPGMLKVLMCSAGRHVHSMLMPVFWLTITDSLTHQIIQANGAWQ